MPRRRPGQRAPRRRRNTTSHRRLVTGVAFVAAVVLVVLLLGRLERVPQAWALPVRWTPWPAEAEPSHRRPTTGSPRLAHAHHYAGLPRATRPEAQHRVLENDGFVIGYSETRQNPLWSCYRVFHVARKLNLPRPKSFAPDDRTHARVTSSDYTRSGYDRGHLAPNDAISDLYGRQAQLDTFLMTNVSPQRPSFNRGIWLTLEQLHANDWPARLQEVWIVTGPIFDEHLERLASGVEVPDRFYKLAVDEDDGLLRVIVWDIPQTAPKDAPLESYLTSVDAIETATGLDFLWGLEDIEEDLLEAATASRHW